MSQLVFNYKSRMKKVRFLIEENGLDYVLLTNLQNLYWLSGTAQYGLLLIHKINYISSGYSLEKQRLLRYFSNSNLAIFLFFAQRLMEGFVRILLTT